MRDIFKPVENSWVAWLGGLSLIIVIIAGLMRWMTVGLIAGVSLLGCCGEIADTQLKILKSHIETLEERMDKLEGKIN